MSTRPWPASRCGLFTWSSTGRYWDHDAPVAYFTFSALTDLSIGITAAPSGQTGAALSYSMSVANAGLYAASDVTLSVPANVSLGSVSVSVPDGWSCSSSGMGALSCSIGSFAAGSTATFAVDALIACSTADGVRVGAGAHRARVLAGHRGGGPCAHRGPSADFAAGAQAGQRASTSRARNPAANRHAVEKNKVRPRT